MLVSESPAGSSPSEAPRVACEQVPIIKSAALPGRWPCVHAGKVLRAPRPRRLRTKRLYGLVMVTQVTKKLVIYRFLVRHVCETGHGAAIVSWRGLRLRRA